MRQSDALAPSLPEIWTMLHVRLQVSSGVSGLNVCATILPFGGHMAGCEATTFVLARAKEYGVVLAGPGTPRLKPNCRSRASSVLPSSHNSARSEMFLLIA